MAACGVLSSNEFEDEVLLSGDCLDDFPKQPEELPVNTSSLMQETPVVEIDLEWGSWADTVNAASSSQTESEESEDVAEVVYEPFLSKITLNGLRVTIMSTIDVVELLLRENYKYVLTGKLNQDCIEVIISVPRIMSVLLILNSFPSAFLGSSG